MEKKMTKTQIKEIEMAKQEKRRLRRRLVDSVKNYWKDCEAVERVAKINKEENMLDYRGYLVEEQKTKLLSNYENLKFLVGIDYKENKSWSVVRTIVESQNVRDNYYSGTTRAKEYLPEDSAWMNEIVWSHDEMKLYIKLFQEYGIDYIYFTNSSSGALESITSLVSLGATVIGTTIIYEDGKGIIFDIKNANIEL